jgi:hypothetical protein
VQKRSSKNAAPGKVWEALQVVALATTSIRGAQRLPLAAPFTATDAPVWQARFFVRARIHPCRQCPKINAAVLAAEGFPSKQQKLCSEQGV